MLRPIDTVYNGYRFRSRLEARWAVFFDVLGVPYDYEPEGYDLGRVGWYLPDFWLPEQRCWVEIKPADNWTFHPKIAALASGSGFQGLYVCGNPWFGDYGIRHHLGDEDWSFCEHPHRFALGRRDEQELWVVHEDCCWHCLNPRTDDARYPLQEAPRIMEAYEAARGARFEHGERGPKV